ncbi:Aminopeptidase N [Vanrija pseudolonga]|uniref:Aminopeptidase N n=1 Tax=Vanrija pseudolonga TaxID=143232 RepID=A0AAF1BJL1_9TREE|nr:Aminopeptidase N [Vanrija pseudolonga]
MSSLLNLTRDECAQRSRELAVDTYRISLDLTALNDPETTTFRSQTKVEFTSTTASTWLDLVADKVTAVTINGASAEVKYNGARVQLDGLVNGPNTVVVTAQCIYSHTGEGLHRFTDPVDGKTYAYTHFEPTDARRVYACFEQPDLKGKITFEVAAPKDVGVFSNQSVASEDGGVTVFNPTLPLSTYLSALAVGPYYVVHDKYEDVPLAAMCRQSMKEYLEAEEIFRITKQGLAFFNKAFGYPYPWGKYDSIFLPEYNIGAMEHPGLVTFSENAYIFRGAATIAQRESRAEVILHEMTHMWFGDLVTPKWWDGTWLKESFADLMGYLVANEAAGFEGPWISFGLGRKQGAYTMDVRPTTHPIATDVPDLEAARQNFDSITYNKGAATLKQLMAYAGRDAFFAASQKYFKRLAFGTATLDDLIASLKETSTADLSEWVPSWLHTTGPSVITTVREGGKLYVETESKDVLTGKDVARNHRVKVSTFARGKKGVERTASVSVLLDKPRVEIPLPEGTVVDLAIANDDDLTYALLRFDDASVDVLVEQLSTVQPTLTRAVAWSALWNMVRDAKLPAARFLDAVINNASTETDSVLLNLILSLGYSAVAAYLNPSFRDAAGARFVAAIASGLSAATPGTDLQRTWANAIAAYGGLSKSSVHTLRETLDGEVTKLELTPTLRWGILRTLASLSAVTDAELEAEYARDKTMTGATALVRARASFPGAENKKRVWDEVTGDDKITNDRQGALLVGFNAGPDSDREAFIKPYFDSLTSWWSAKTMTMASRLVLLAFPDTTVNDGQVGNNKVELLAQGWLDANPDAPRALRRIIIERLDDTRRVLRGQA